MLILLLLSISGIMITVEANSPASPKISPSLQARLNKGEKVSVLVSFDGTEDICRLDVAKPRSAITPDRGQVLTTMKNNLVSKMDISQSGVALLMSGRSSGSASHFTQFWITNQMFVGQAEPKLIKSIADDPKVSKIEEEPKVVLFQEDRVIRQSNAKPHANGDPQPNLYQVKVPEAWAELGENRGEGIVIGFLDTGVRWTHELVKDKYVGEYGWYDPRSKTSEPRDDFGHGTHVTGIAVGGKGIGVAPGAKWSACRFCGPGLPECSVEEAFLCGQFFACPTLANGTNHDCSKAPHIINNSWGSHNNGSDYFDPIIKCWHAAGIIPVFAMGNTGFDNPCNSTQYPVSHPDVIAVGNIGANDTFSETSSRGPTRDGRIKPDLVAPGEWIISGGGDGDAEYTNWVVGTSQSTPHVTGAIALLLSRNKQLNYEQIREKLLASVDPVVVKGAPTCGNVSVDVFPNNVVGYGRLNVLKLIQSASS